MFTCIGLACLCNESGSDPSAGESCNATTGQCTCKENVEGVKCTSCKTSFFNLQSSNPTGCEGLCACGLRVMSCVCTRLFSNWCSLQLQFQWIHSIVKGGM